jgi:hypothetical protein
MARTILEEELPAGAGLVDHEFVSRLERRFRLAGAEDLVILVTNGDTPPMPAAGAKLSAEFSVSLALEYRGHWVKVIRNAAGVAPEGTLADDLTGPYPYELGEAGSLYASRAEVQVAGRRLFFGDTNL